MKRSKRRRPSKAMSIVALSLLGAIVLGLIVFFQSWPFANRDYEKCPRCNIILVSIDSLRADRMSLYGYSRPTTPFIDKWAATNALVFENFFSTSFLTPVSEGSIHTGLYPEISGMVGFRNFYSDKISTLAEILKKNGYLTFALGNSPEYTVYDSLRESFSRGFHDYYRFQPMRAKFLDWERIESLISGARDRPFFLWLGVGSVHAPFGFNKPNKFALTEYNGPFKSVITIGNLAYYWDGKLYNPTIPGRRFQFADRSTTIEPVRLMDSSNSLKYPVQLGKADLAYINDNYDNNVLHGDTEVEKLLSLVTKYANSNTIVIIQSEHGEGLGEHKYIAHYDITENTVRVPLIFSSPRLKAGRSKELVSGVDVFPTLLEHVDVALPNYPLDGRSFIDYKKQSIGPGRSEVYLARIPLWESMMKLDKPGMYDRFRELDDKIGFKDYGIRTNSKKVIHRLARRIEEQYSAFTFVSGEKIARQEWESYDLSQDPGELNPSFDADPTLKQKLIDFENDMKKRSRTGQSVNNLQEYR